MIHLQDHIAIRHPTVEIRSGVVTSVSPFRVQILLDDHDPYNPDVFEFVFERRDGKWYSDDTEVTLTVLPAVIVGKKYKRSGASDRSARTVTSIGPAPGILGAPPVSWTVAYFDNDPEISQRIKHGVFWTGLENVPAYDMELVSSVEPEPKELKELTGPELDAELAKGIWPSSRECFQALVERYRISKTILTCIEGDLKRAEERFAEAQVKGSTNDQLVYSGRIAELKWVIGQIKVIVE